MIAFDGFLNSAFVCCFGDDVCLSICFEFSPNAPNDIVQKVKCKNNKPTRAKKNTGKKMINS